MNHNILDSSTISGLVPISRLDRLRGNDVRVDFRLNGITAGCPFYLRLYPSLVF